MEGKSAYHFKIKKGDTTYTMTLRYLAKEKPYHVRIAEEKDGRLIGRKGNVFVEYVPSKQTFVMQDKEDKRDVVTAVAETICKVVSG